jgi:hypothetical protein
MPVLLGYVFCNRDLDLIHGVSAPK